MRTYNDYQTTNELGLRWYHTPKGAYPSITTILGTTQPESAVKALAGWRNALGAEKAAAVSKKATDRGTMVHLLAERYLKKEVVDAPVNGNPVPQTELASFNALRLKLDKINEVWAQECALFSDFFEVAGRCDLVGRYKGEPVIVDFKTSSRIKGKADISDYKLQLAFYAAAHNEMYGTEIKTGVILMVAETGFPMEFIVPLEEQYEELQNRIDAFWKKTLNREY